jgi:hypothetical protein
MPASEPRSVVGEDGQEYIDRSSVDFDPDAGHFSGTAVDGTTEVPGPHELVDDVLPESE